MSTFIRPLNDRIEALKRWIKEEEPKEKELVKKLGSAVTSDEKKIINAEIRAIVAFIDSLDNKLASLEKERDAMKGGRRIKKSKRTHKRKQRGSKTRKH